MDDYEHSLCNNKHTKPQSLACWLLSSFFLSSQLCILASFNSFSCNSFSVCTWWIFFSRLCTRCFSSLVSFSYAINTSSCSRIISTFAFRFFFICTLSAWYRDVKSLYFDASSSASSSLLWRSAIFDCWRESVCLASADTFSAEIRWASVWEIVFSWLFEWWKL